MTTYTTITNALVAVGAKPFATTIQALRDNPLAIAEGDATAPKIAFAAIVGGVAGISLGAVGSYAFCSPITNNIAITAGSTIAGSSLYYASATITAATAGLSMSARTTTSPAGTWRALGGGSTVAGGTATAAVATLYLRIA